MFGDGHEYDWALVDDELEHEDELYKADMRYQDVSHSLTFFLLSNLCLGI